LFVEIRGSKSVKIPVDISFVIPEIVVDRQIIDFGKIPIMSNNFEETIVLTNLHRTEVRLEASKNFDLEDYFIEFNEGGRASRCDEDLTETDARQIKKRGKEEGRARMSMNNNQILRLIPNVPTTIELKFTPKKIKTYKLFAPLKLCGTGATIIEPIY
jgi:hypothetical protein